MFSIEELNAGLEKLTGADFEDAEKRVRSLGDVTPIISLSTKFQIELAAIALETNANELKALPVKKYAQIANAVSTFLFDISETETPAES